MRVSQVRALGQMERLVAPLRYRRFVLICACEAASQLGSLAFDVALVWLVAGSTRSTMLLGLVLATRYLPMLLVLLVGGAWADRTTPPRILLGANLGNAAITLLFAGLVLLGHQSFPGLLLVVALYGLVAAFRNPALSALFPALLPQYHYAAANSLRQMTLQCAALVAPALSGLLISLWGVEGALILVSLAFTVAALTVFPLCHETPADATTAGSPVIAARHLAPQQLLAGFQFLLTRRGMLVTIALFSITNALNNAEATLVPVLARSQLHLPASSFGLLASFFGLGSLAGALMMGALHGRIRRPALAICGGTMALGLSIVLMGMARDARALDGAYLLFGLAFIVPEIVTSTLWQRMIPGDLRGRVFAALNMAALAANPLGFLFAGLIGHSCGPRQGLWIGGGLIAALGVLGIFAPSVRTLGRKPSTQASPAWCQLADADGC